MQRLFKKIKVLVVKNYVQASTWKTFYENKEVDGLDIKVNGFGRVVKLDLTLNAKLVKSLNLDQIETIPERDF